MSFRQICRQCPRTRSACGSTRIFNFNIGQNLGDSKQANPARHCRFWQRVCEAREKGVGPGSARITVNCWTCFHSIVWIDMQAFYVSMNALKILYAWCAVWTELVATVTTVEQRSIFPRNFKIRVAAAGLMFLRFAFWKVMCNRFVENFYTSQLQNILNNLTSACFNLAIAHPIYHLPDRSQLSVCAVDFYCGLEIAVSDSSVVYPVACLSATANSHYTLDCVAGCTATRKVKKRCAVRKSMTILALQDGIVPCPFAKGGRVRGKWMQNECLYRAQDDIEIEAKGWSHLLCWIARNTLGYCISNSRKFVSQRRRSSCFDVPADIIHIPA